MTKLALAIAVKGPWEADRLLHHLQAAGVPASTEIHVACDVVHEPASPRGRLIIHAIARKSLFELWAIAIRGSNSPWIAILHADALPAPGWYEAVDEAIGRSQGCDGFWGPVEPGVQPHDVRMVAYLTEYVQFHRPAHPRLLEVPGSNLILPRAVLGSMTEFSKTKLVGHGLTPARVDEAVVLYTRPIRFPAYCRRRYRHARAYAATRVPRPPLPVAIAMTLALPAIRTVRVFRHAWRHRHLRMPVLRWFSHVAIAETWWSAGELVGYWTRRQGALPDID